MNVGIIGCGHMAEKMARTIRMLPEFTLYACASRSTEKAQNFAAVNGVKHAFGSYEELVLDPNVDLVYIATPHSQHAENMRLCISGQKPVLCEKSFTLDAQQAEEIFELAKERNVFVTEALWTRYIPMAKKLRQVIDSGLLGKITSASAAFGLPVSYRDRVMRKELGGGALLDVGIYCLTFLSIALGNDVEKIIAAAQISDEGVDLQDNIILTYANGAQAQVNCSVINPTDSRGCVYGTDGYAVVGRMNNYEFIEIYGKDRKLVDRIDKPEQLTGYEYELLCSRDAILSGKTECEEMPHKETVEMMRLMDRIRAELHVEY